MSTTPWTFVRFGDDGPVYGIRWLPVRYSARLSRMHSQYRRKQRGWR